MSKKHHQFLSWVLIFSFLLPNFSWAEKGYTQVTPNSGGGGEQYHGSAEGKLLIRVLIIGAAGQGIHYYPENINMLDALLYAGALTDQAKLNGIKIRRRGIKDLVIVNMEDLIEEGSVFPELKDGDIVHIPFSWRHDMTTISLVTGLLTSMTGFALAVIALAK